MARRRLEGMRVVVTGASSGIGAQLVRQLIDSQALVVATARRGPRLAELRRSLGPGSEHLYCIEGDITHDDIRNKVIRAAEQNLGGLDTLINNAGAGAMGDFAEADAGRLRAIMEVNFFAPVELIRLALPQLSTGRDPVIVNVGSVLGHRAVRGKSEYCASKFALHGFSDALRAELSETGIGVLHACPSTTASEFFERVMEGSGPGTPRGAMSPRSVAAKILRAIQSRKDELIISCGGKALVWLDRCCPTLANRVIARFS